MATDPNTTRRPYTGSCHCGATKYIVFLTLPLATQSLNQPSQTPVQRVYRCNCTTCHKAGLMHIRLASAPDDFLLLSPLDPLVSLGDYQCFDKALHFLFCKTCGMRCFTFMGKGEVTERDLTELDVYEVGTGQVTKVWSPRREGWKEGKDRGCYLSVNGYTIDAGQVGFDLREWTEQKRVLYLDCLELDGVEHEDRYERPHVGGAY